LNALTLPEFERISTIASEALAVLDAGAPEVSGEIRSLLEEVVFANGDADDKITFHGISSFCLWGAIVMNAEGHKTPLEVLQTIAHESSHMHLFGVALNSPLVLNDDDERYKSPLRFDPRPMDGIYHAVYVSARMHYALTRVLSSGVLSPTQIEEARAACLIHVKSFREGLATVQAEGTLSELGHDLMSQAKSYMLPYLSA
jgi:HEXXH motif-containing protein